MNITNDQKFSDLLVRRAVPPASRNLTALIVAAAMRAPQILATFSLSQWLQDLFSDFMLPKPAYALGGMLAVGFVVGFVIAPMTVTEDTSAGHAILMDEGDIP